MYEDNERRISWLGILKRVIIILLVLIIIFGIITLVTKCTKKTDNKKTIEPTVTLKSQITDIQNATLKYITVETLPTAINQTKTVKLKYLINKNLISNLKDSNGNVCDTDASYSEITKLENNYAMKTTVVCGKNKDYSVVYIGCFDSCKDGICIGSESQKDGICTASSNDSKNDNKGSENSTDNNKETTKTTTTTTKTTKTTTTTSPKIMYEYKKANYTYYCNKGELVGTNDCKVSEVWTYIGKVKETSTPKTYTYTTDAKVEKVSFTNPSSAKNTTTTTYELLSYKNGLYNYNKYSCTNGNINGKTCTVTTTTYDTVKSCEDDSYTYNASTNQCTKKVVVNIYEEALIKSVTYDYTWSDKTSLPGWTRTGAVK